ncbi:hypothetical protein [Marinimicrococcus flavescens]|uniref:Antitoxin n=1 Tax=Marinimicrococcus flavescens TaxID=3031815 RepID=A0AAP3XQH0_9PROT|nr:hypothetical protein [Marinimicrococcus flavescens]
MAEAEADHLPASQVVRELMREHVVHRREERGHEASVARKVEAARVCVRAGSGVPSEEIDAEFAARCARAELPSMPGRPRGPQH